MTDKEKLIKVFKEIEIPFIEQPTMIESSNQEVAVVAVYIGNIDLKSASFNFNIMDGEFIGFGIWRKNDRQS